MISLLFVSFFPFQKSLILTLYFPLGGINDSNALHYLECGASHIIVTSYVFSEGNINFARLEELSILVGKDRLVIDLSCRKKKGEEDGLYYVVTNKWTKYTDYPVTLENLEKLSQYCSEFLIHGVEVEGKRYPTDLIQSITINQVWY